MHFAASGIADKLQRIQGTVPESTWRAYATRRIELALVSELHRQPAGRGRKP